MFATLMEERASSGVQIFPEFVLPTEPQRPDRLLVRRTDVRGCNEQAQVIDRYPHRIQTERGKQLTSDLPSERPSSSTQAETPLTELEIKKRLERQDWLRNLSTPVVDDLQNRRMGAATVHRVMLCASKVALGFSHRRPTVCAARAVCQLASPDAILIVEKTVFHITQNRHTARHGLLP